MLMVFANVLRQESRTAEKGFSSSLGVGTIDQQLPTINQHVTEYYMEPMMFWNEL